MPDTDKSSTLDCPKMEPLILGCTWKGFSAGVKSCSIGCHVHKNRIELTAAAATFNNRRLTVKCSTKEVDQDGLFEGTDDPVIEVEAIADTAAMSCSGDKFTFRLTFPKDSVDVLKLSNFCSKNGTLTVKDIAAKVKPEKAPPPEQHPDLQTGGDRPSGGLGAFDALSTAVKEMELSKLCHDGTEKPVLSETVAYALAQTGISTFQDLQNLMVKKPEFWETELLKVKGLGKQKLEQLTEAYQLYMAKNGPADESGKQCGECGQCFRSDKCDNCGSTFWQAIHDDTLSDEFEWPLDAVDREPVANVGGCNVEMLLKKCEFGFWHYGVYISIDCAAEDGEGTELAEYGYQPSLIGNKLDEETARARALQAVADELIGVADDFPDHAGVKESTETVTKMLPAD